MTVHNMKLSPSAFAAIFGGGKFIEMRLNDAKRRLVSPGDSIVFTCTADGRQGIARVVGVRTFGSFEQLYAAYPPAALGYAKGQAANPCDMRAYYSQEEERKYGVVAIQIEV